MAQDRSLDIPQFLERRSEVEPFFSICVPQHNRTRHLMEALRMLKTQTFQDFEICISDDRSTDGLQFELITYLRECGMAFAYRLNESNLRYDRNLRSSIKLARGTYCVLMGNDDCLTDDDTLQDLYRLLTGETGIGVLIGNFQDWRSGEVNHRVHRDAIYPGTAVTAANHYRNLAFVSGLIIDRRKAQSFETEKWDGSEMYQMGTFCSVIASGGKLLETTMSLTRKDMMIPGEVVDSYARRQRIDPCPIIERKLPFVEIGDVVVSSIEPFLPPDVSQAAALREQVFQQLYRFTYPFWLIEYRRVQSWNYSAGLCLGIRTKNVVKGHAVGVMGRIRLNAFWAAMCCAGLFMPLRIFDLLKSRLYRLSKSFGS
jgi:hypothetical protein